MLQAWLPGAVLLPTATVALRRGGIAPPQGATHFELLFGASLMSFATGTYTQATVAAPLGVLALNSATISNRDVVAAFPAAPTSRLLIVGVLGINFYQQLNGQYYPLNNNSTNPLAIEYIAGSGSVGGGSGNVASRPTHTCTVGGQAPAAL